MVSFYIPNSEDEVGFYKVLFFMSIMFCIASSEQLSILGSSNFFSYIEV
jgi:hypothetical protein